MLYSFFLSFKFIRYIQSGLYVDYIIKKLGEILVKNIFIYSSLFFGEKFIIEFLTKKVIDNYTILSNIKLFNKTYFFSTFFTQIIIVTFYSVGAFELLYFLY
jgi:hypothetical protein